MSQCDRCSVSDVLVPEVRDESEDIGRDLVDWCKPISLVPDEAEDFKRVLLESVDLEDVTCKLLLICL